MYCAYNRRSAEEIILRKTIKFFFNQYVGRQDRILLYLVLTMAFIGFICMGINWLFVGYQGMNYLPWQWLVACPFMLVLLGFACFAREESPRLAALTRGYSWYYFLVLTMAIMINGLQLTFLPTIDPLLADLDLRLGINTPVLIEWTAHHSIFKFIFEKSYALITLELFFLPVILASFKNQRAINEFLMIFMFSFIIGGIIYYIFPTSAPVSVFSSPYFSASEHNTFLKFYQIHHFLKPTTDDGGLIAFPSFHVVYAIMCAYVLRHKIWLFIPILIINLIAIVSTVMLGWHYLIDVFGGIIVVLVGINFVSYILNPESVSKMDSGNFHIRENFRNEN